MCTQLPLGTEIRKSHDTGQLQKRIMELEDRLSILEQALKVTTGEVNLKVEESSFTMKKDGTISLHGKDITLNAFGKITIKASSDLVLKGMRILEN